MKPLNTNPFDNENQRIVREKARSEIKEFINANCTYAELPKFDDVTLQTSIKRYEKAIYSLGRISDIQIRSHKGMIIAEKLKRR